MLPLRRELEKGSPCASADLILRELTRCMAIASKPFPCEVRLEGEEAKTTRVSFASPGREAMRRRGDERQRGNEATRGEKEKLDRKGSTHAIHTVPSVAWSNAEAVRWWCWAGVLGETRAGRLLLLLLLLEREKISESPGGLGSRETSVR